MTEQDIRRKKFEEIALPHLAALYSFGFRMLKDSDDAQDLVQETYLRAFRFFESFQEGTNAKAWLFRILKNTFINRFRKHSNQPVSVELDVHEDHDGPVSIVDTLESADSDAFEFVLSDEISVALDELAPEFRTVIILCDLEDLPYEEVALFTDCPIGTVRSRLHRARRILGKKLQDVARERGYKVTDL